MTMLELLANELLLELFEFFDGIQLFHGFYGLNSRFDNLLLKYFLHYHLNFQSASKENIRNFCQKYLSLIIDQVISLRLSDEDDDLQQTDIFICNHFNLHQFIHLKSLTLDYIYSIETVNKIISNCLGLTHLTLNGAKLRSGQSYIPIDLNNIWNLPKLMYFNLKTDGIKISLLPLTVTSLTLEHLILGQFPYTQPDFISLFVHTPRLQRLHIHDYIYMYDRHLLSSLSPIITLQRFFLHANRNTMMLLLQKMPNLYHLTVDVKRNSFADGYEWERIIINYLPKLKIFRLKMHFKCLNDRETRVNKLLDSFRSSFWIEKHQWFVRCHWDPEGESKFIFLYTIPYGFHYFPFNNTVIKYKSTYPDDDEFNSYNRVHQLYCSAHASRDFSKFHIRFPNIHHLYIQLPMNDRCWSIIPMLDKISSLNIILRGDDSQSQLLTLFNGTSYLNRLRFQLEYKRNKSYLMAAHHLIKITREDNSQQYSTTVHCSHPYVTHEVHETLIKKHTDLLDLMNSIINSTEPSILTEEVDWENYYS